MSNNNLDKIIDEVVTEVGHKEVVDRDSINESFTKLREPIKYIVSSIADKIDIGPIHIDEQANHPYSKPTLDIIYVERRKQQYAEVDITISQHILTDLNEEVESAIKKLQFTPAKPFGVCYETHDRAGAIESKEFGRVNQYKFSQFTANAGSISARLIGEIDWE